MKEFDDLLALSERLLGPEGCPWDRKQTLFTLQPYLLEEAHELMEAIDQGKPEKIAEELGDVFYALIFIAKLGEREKSFSLASALLHVTEKLIRRHPHIFANEKISSSEEMFQKWEEIKQKEGKKSPISDIPPTLPALARAQKIIHKMRGKKSAKVEEAIEEGIGQELWDLVKRAEAQGIDAESALRRLCLSYESLF